jgi:hypothetical protein
MGWALRAIHTACGVPTTCSAHHRRSTIYGLCCIDGTCGPVASGDPHVPTFMWQDHGDASGYRHDPWSSHRRHSDLWPSVSRRVERVRRGCYRHSTPRSSYLEGTEDRVIQRYAQSCLWYMDGELLFSNLNQFLCN